MANHSHFGLVRRAAVLTLATSLWPIAVPAESAASPSVTAAMEQVRPYRFFGGGTVRVPVHVHAAPSDSTPLRARLVQLTARLAAPVGDEVTIVAPASANGLVDVELPLPAVERQTRFELRVQARTGNGSDAEWRPAGRIPLVVYPADLLAPMRVWSEKHPLRLKDDGALTPLLKDHGIQVTAASVVRPRGGISLRTGEFARRFTGSPAVGETIVLFMERDAELPHVVIEPAGSGTVVRVEGRLLADVTTNPESQQALLEIFKLALDHIPTEGGIP